VLHQPLVSVEMIRNRAAGSILKVMDGLFGKNGQKQDMDGHQKGESRGGVMAYHVHPPHTLF
jgi:hypothetical protein